MWSIVVFFGYFVLGISPDCMCGSNNSNQKVRISKNSWRCKKKCNIKEDVGLNWKTWRFCFLFVLFELVTLCNDLSWGVFFSVSFLSFITILVGNFSVTICLWGAFFLELQRKKLKKIGNRGKKIKWFVICFCGVSSRVWLSKCRVEIIGIIRKKIFVFIFEELR